MLHDKWLYGFGDRCRDRIKIIDRDGNGFRLLMKRSRLIYTMSSSALTSAIRGSVIQSASII
ncbi:hypothetical protein BLA15816_00644 [Burkholderia lata]|nr:hypothetical protein BLA15816_00644 [Burkholderia lata]